MSEIEVPRSMNNKTQIFPQSVKLCSDVRDSSLDWNSNQASAEWCREMIKSWNLLFDIFAIQAPQVSPLSLLPLNTISTGSSSQDIVSFLILTPLLPSTGSACLAVSAFPSSRNRSSFDHWSNPPQSRSCPSHNLSPVAGPDLGDSNQCQDNWLSQSQMSRANTNTSPPPRQNSGNCVLGVLVRWSAWWLSVLAVVCHTVRRWQQT